MESECVLDCEFYYHPLFKFSVTEFVFLPFKILYVHTFVYICTNNINTVPYTKR